MCQKELERPEEQTLEEPDRTEFPHLRILAPRLGSAAHLRQETDSPLGRPRSPRDGDRPEPQITAAPGLISTLRTGHRYERSKDTTRLEASASSNKKLRT